MDRAASAALVARLESQMDALQFELQTASELKTDKLHLEEQAARLQAQCLETVRRGVGRRVLMV